jgi:hypothetical protein
MLKWQRMTALVLACLLGLLAGCANNESWMILTVRDGLSRAPVAEPVLTITPKPSLLGNPSPETTTVANAFGTARIKLATGQVSYTVTVDAPGYDLFTFSLPNFNDLFPSGRWLEGDKVRRYELRPDNVLELMVTLEPRTGPN